jgi:hypothetical protein
LPARTRSRYMALEIEGRARLLIAILNGTEDAGL